MCLHTFWSPFIAPNEAKRTGQGSQTTKSNFLNALAERRLPPIPFAAQGRATPEVSVFGARRLPIPAARGPLNLLRA